MENKEYRRTKIHTDIYTESSAEYVLPDYNGDIRRILFSEASVRPAGKFASESDVEFTGVVVYNVVYSDPKGELCSASFSSDYEYKVKTDEYVDAVSDVRVANLSVRATGPKKLSARASIAARAAVVETGAIATSGSALEGDCSPELLTKSIDVRATAISETVEREYAENIATLDGAISDEVRVVYSGAEVNIEESELRDGALYIEGELELFAVIKNGDDAPFVAERSVDINAEIPFEGAECTMSFIPRATLVSLKDSINSTETGTDVVLSAIVEYSAVGECNRSAEVLSDAYLKEFESECTYEDFRYSELVGAERVCESLEVKVPRSELECEPLREILFITAEPKICECVPDGNGMRVRGELRICGVAYGIDDNGNAVFSPIKFNSDFVKNVNLNCQICDNMRVEPTIMVRKVRGSFDAENVYASTELDVYASVICDKSERHLSHCEVKGDAAIKRDGSTVRVYYPQHGETLFSVAKRFHVSAAALAMDNSISAPTSALGSDGELSEVKKLLIL